MWYINIIIFLLCSSRQKGLRDRDTTTIPHCYAYKEIHAK